MDSALEKTRVTLHDVATHAGVSHQTVSRVINKSGNVHPETRAKVEAAIEKLGYRPNMIARSMVSGNTRTLGCISPNLTNYIFTKIIESAQAEAQRQGFFILTGSASTIDDVKPLLDELLNRRVDGLMILNPRDDKRYRLLEPLSEKGVPIIYLKNTSTNQKISSVNCDDQKGGYLATKHLIDLGHTAIATISGLRNEECSSDRLHGYHQALEEAGISPNNELLVEGNWTAQSGINAVEKLNTYKRNFSAIFAQNDQMALGAIRGLRKEGFKIPEDYSVIGYDDIPLAAIFDPPLTTIRQPLDEFGEQAAEIIIRVIKDPNKKAVQVRLSPTLIKRKTSAAFQIN
jgi:DNA-binding LacI/PurR family transcriptional regulator